MADAKRDARHHAIDATTPLYHLREALADLLVNDKVPAGHARGLVMERFTIVENALVSCQAMALYGLDKSGSEEE